MSYKSIPIGAARQISEKYDKAQVLVFAWDSVYKKTHITTYGKTKRDCRMAAIGGDRVAQMMGLKFNSIRSEGGETLDEIAERINSASIEEWWNMKATSGDRQRALELATLPVALWDMLWDNLGGLIRRELRKFIVGAPGSEESCPTDWVVRSFEEQDAGWRIDNGL